MELPFIECCGSTGIESYKDKWTYPYRHWSFKPSNYCRDYSQAKP